MANYIHCDVEEIKYNAANQLKIDCMFDRFEANFTWSTWDISPTLDVLGGRTNYATMLILKGLVDECKCTQVHPSHDSI